MPADPLAVDAPLDSTPELTPAELKTAIAALPAGHICLLTPRVDTLEKQFGELAAAFQSLVPLLTAGKEFAERVDALEAAVAAFKAPTAPAGHDARIQLLEDAMKGLAAIAPALEQHFGIKL